MELGSSELAILDRLLEARTGQQLNDSRYWRVARAVESIMRSHGFRDTDALFALLTSKSGYEVATQIVEAMVNNETSFFRDATMFKQLRNLLADTLTEKGSPRPYRIWSAGCSTGQEPYSLAIMHGEMSHLRGRKIDIVATDISGGAIDRAREGLYSQFEIQRGLSVRAMIRDFSQEGEKWRIRDKLRESVTFREHNLLEPQAAGPFDLILCRNVLFYFSMATRAKVLSHLRDALAPGGTLILGAGETLIGLANGLDKIDGGYGFYRLHSEERRDIAVGG